MRDERDVRRRRLLLVASRKGNHHPSFDEIRREIVARAPEIDCVVIEDRHWRAPSLGAREECRALEAAGVRLPRWTIFGPDEVPDLSDFPEYVVTKPDLGWRGAEVRIRRKRRVRYEPPSRPLPQDDDRTIVQEFICTGAWPVSYRVTSFFGHPLFCWRVEADRARRPLEAPDAFAGGERGGGMSIVSSGKDCVFTLCDDPEILACGTDAHCAFPDVPLLGVDVVRDARTGECSILEVDASGYVWHFDSETGRGIQRDHGIDFRRQFGAIERAAEILIEQTRRRAR